MDEFIGTNIWWDFYGKNLEDPGITNINVLNNSLQGFFENLDAVGFVREFHNWYLHEGIEAGCPNANLCYTNTPELPSPPYSEGVKFKFKTAYQGQASCINFDYFYELLLQHMGSNFVTSMSGSATNVIKDFVAEPICGFTSAQERIPVNSSNPADFLNPQNYKEFATYLYHFAYRYGSDASTPTASHADILTNLAPESQTSFVNNPAIRSVTSHPIKYISIWNEPDKWWLESSIPHTYISPEEYGAMLSAVADGHEGQVNHKNLYTLGIMNADSNMKIVLGGISDLDPCYFQSVTDWLNQNRAGADKFPFDVFNYHHYSQVATANLQISQLCSPINADQLNAWDYGVSPEHDKLKEKLIALRQTMIDKGNTFNQDWNNKEFWITEYGYDTHPASVQAAIPENNPITGQNNLRSMVPTNYRPFWNALSQSHKNVLLELVELTQARWITRSYLEIAAAGFDRAVAYEFADRAEIGNYQSIGPYTESGRYLTSGMLFFDPAQPAANRFTRKASWHFINTMKQMLTGYKFNSEVSYNNCNDAVSSICPRIYKFTKAGAADIWAMWLPTSNESVSSLAVNLGLPAGSTLQMVKLADGFPNGQSPIALTVGANGLLAVNNLSETPVFIKAGSSTGSQSQTITLPVIANQIVSAPPFMIAGTASSGLPVSFQIVSGPATISSNTITLTGQVGTVVVRATQAGNANWTPAAAVERSFTVSQTGLQNQTIIFSTIPNKTTTSPPFTAIASASSGLPVAFQIVSGPAFVSGNTITLNGQVGTVVVRVTQAGNAQWNPAAAVDIIFIVTQQSGGGTIDLSLSVTNAPANLVKYNNMDFTFTVTNSGAATATNVQVHVPTPTTVVFVGTNVATLSQGIYNWIGNRIWHVGSLAPGASATMTVHWYVLDTDQLMGWAQVNHADQTDTDSTPNNAQVGVAGEDDEVVKNIGSGQVPPNMENQLTTFGMLANKLTTDPQFTLNASASSGLAVTFDVVSGPATVSGNTVTLTGQAGSVSINASQTGNADFHPAPNVNRTFQVTTPSPNGMDLKLAMTANSPNVTQWGLISYTATLTNEGTVAATGVKVHFPAPATAVLHGGNESVASKGSYAAYSDQQWTVGTMAPGEVQTLKLTFYVLQNVPLTGYAQVSAASPNDIDSAPNNGLPPVPIEDDEAAFTAGIFNGNGPDLELTLTSSSNTLTIWKDVVFTVTLKNVGNASATGVKVAVPIPQGLAYTIHHRDEGTTYNLVSQLWTVGTMAPGATKTMSMTLFVLQNTTPLPYFVQVMTASPADVDSSPNNNTSGTPAEDDEALVTLQPPSNQAIGLPGKVFSLFASQNGATANLRWTTNSGKHCLRYLLERSANGFEWQVLLDRDNDEQSDNFITYRELDVRPLPGWNYYRVVQLRDDGSLAFSNVQMLEFWEELDDFKLFPNPADAYVKVNLRSVEGQTVRLLLIDRMGRLVKEAWVEPASLEPYRFDLTGVHEGWYAVWIQAEGRRPKSLPLMVSKF